LGLSASVQQWRMPNWLARKRSQPRSEAKESSKLPTCVRGWPSQKAGSTTAAMPAAAMAW
jgi:hypothetical protein